MVTGSPVRNRTPTSTAPLNGTCLRESEYPARSETTVATTVDTMARYRLLRMSRPAPMLNAPSKFSSEKRGAARPGPAWGLNAARISQTRGSRNQSPMSARTRLMIHRDRRRWPGAAETWASSLLSLAGRRRLTLVRTLMSVASVSLLSFLGLGQLGPELPDIDDRQQRANEHDGQRDGRAISEGVELEGLDVHVDGQDGRGIARASLRHHEYEREIG